MKLPKILPAPIHPSNIKGEAKWLAGEGAGSWFLIQESEAGTLKYRIIRYSPEGIPECESSFTASKKIDLEKEYTITYPSHCAKVTVKQDSKTVTLMRN